MATTYYQGPCWGTIARNSFVRAITLSNIFWRRSRMCFPIRTSRPAAFRQMAGYLVLDAIILNTDRHHENWAHRSDSCTKMDGCLMKWRPRLITHLALGRNEPPDKLATWLSETWAAEWYAAREPVPGGIYLRSDDAHGANPLRLLELVARKWPDYFVPWLPNLENVYEDALCDTVDRVPVETMVQAQRDFAKALLRVTLSTSQRHSVMKTLFLAWQDKRLRGDRVEGSRAWFPIGRLDADPERCSLPVCLYAWGVAGQG